MVRTICLLLMVSGVARADIMYRCVGKGGAVSYQDYPCDKGSKVAGQLSSRRSRCLAIDRYEVWFSPSQLRRCLPREAWPQGAYLPIDPNTQACNSAKAYREQTLKQVGLRRTCELLQRLDENVRRACK